MDYKKVGDKIYISFAEIGPVSTRNIDEMIDIYDLKNIYEIEWDKYKTHISLKLRDFKKRMMKGKKV